MASYPPLSSGHMALFPLGRRVTMPVSRRRAANGAEQRWISAPRLNRFTLSYAGLSATDRDLILNFFDSTKGGFDATWDITIGGVLYEYMCFVESTIKATESQAESWSLQVQMRQVRTSGLPAASPPASFPTLEGGFRTYREWFFDREYVNRVVDMASGKRWAYNAAPNPLRGWHVGGDTLPDPDVSTLLEFALGAGGSYRTFSFTDPETAVPHAKCRLDDEGIRIEHRGPNENRIRMNVVEVPV